MKVSECCQHLHFFVSDHVFERSTNIDIVETDPTGSGTITFACRERSIVFAPKEKRSLLWVKNERCADGAFITFDEGGVHLHIAELKSTLNFGKWSRAIEQFCGMFLSVLSAARLLQIRDFSSVTCYIAFKSEQMSAATSTSPVLLKAPVGSGSLPLKTRWDKEVVELPLATFATLKKIQRDGSGNASFVV